MNYHLKAFSCMQTIFLWIQLTVLFNSKHQLTFICKKKCLCFGMKLIKTMLFSKMFCLPSFPGFTCEQQTVLNVCSRHSGQLSITIKCDVVNPASVISTLQTLYLTLLQFAPCVSFLQTKLMTNSSSRARRQSVVAIYSSPHQMRTFTMKEWRSARLF